MFFFLSGLQILQMLIRSFEIIISLIFFTEGLDSILPPKLLRLESR